MINEVVILAGGKATRLYPVTHTVAKAMLDINGEPFIAHQLRLLKRQGIKRVVICAGYLAEQISSYVKQGQDFGLDVEFSLDGDKLLGTGGAIKKALPLLGNSFFVMYGDSYLDSDFLPIAEKFKHERKSALMTVLKNNGRWDKSNILYQDGNIVKYDKKNIIPEMEYIDYGLGIIRHDVLQNIVEDVFDLADVYKRLADNKDLVAYEVFQRFYEIGSFNGIEETREYIASRIQRS